MKKYTLGFVMVWMLLVGCQPIPKIVTTATPIPPKLTVNESTFLPSPTTRVNSRMTVEVTKDIVYTIPLQDGVASERMLDIYAPEESGPWPIVVFLHGGVGQNKDDQTVTSKMLAQQGFVVFTPTWPVSAYASASADHGRGFREIAETLACAVRFAKAQAPYYGGDPTRVVLSGFSAGGGAGATAALLGKKIDSSWTAYASTTGGPPSQISCLEDQTSAGVFAFIGIGGYYDDLTALKEEDAALWSLVSYQALIGRNSDLLIRLIHGEQDDAAHFWRATSFQEALAQNGYDVALISHTGSHYVPRELFFDTIHGLMDD